MKKKSFVSAILGVFIMLGMCFFVGCTNGKGTVYKIPEVTNGKVLVAYFSATGTTARMAKYIKDYLNADIFEITPAIPYTSADLNYGDSSSRTSIENRDDSARPEIAGRVDNMDEYDIIFIGYPIWHGKAPKVIYTFLEQYDLSGKTIIPFCTAASSNIGSSADYLEKSTTGADWLSGTGFLSSATQKSVENWVDAKLTEKEN